jgi:ABC-type branched-subunit amino acid transport system substrate-binding protein
MTTHRPGGSTVLASVAAVALLVTTAACSSSGSDSPTSGSGGGTINVGELFPLTGSIASAGDRFLYGAQAAVQDVNAHGGVLGDTLKQYTGDTAGDAVDTVPALRQLQTDNLTFLVGPTSVEFSSVSDIIESSNIIDFANIPSVQFDTLDSPRIWKVLVPDSTLAAGMAYYAIHKGLTSCSVMFENVESAQALLPELVKAYTSHGGTILANIQLTPHATSYRSEVEKAFQNNPKCLFLQTDPTTSGTLFTDIRQLGHYNIAFVGTDEYTDPNVAKAIGLSTFSKYATGMQGALPSGAAYSYFSAVFEKMFKGQAPNYFSAANYDAVIVAALAMTAAKSTNPSVWNNYIETVANPPGITCSTFASCVSLLKAGKKINYEGASGPVDYDKDHNVTTGFDVTTFTPSGSLETVLSIPGQALSGY